MKRRLRLLVWAVVGVGLAAALVASFRPRPVPVDLAPVKRGPLRLTVDEDGKTRIKERYVVSTPLTGRLQRIELKPGAAVKAGHTVVATVEPSDPALLDARARAEAQARVKAAEAALRSAKAKLERAKAAHELEKLHFARARQVGPSGGVTKDELDRLEHAEWMAREERRSAEFSVQVSEFEAEQARAALSPPKVPNGPEDAGVMARFEIRSPINGTVLRVFQESTAVVPAGTRLLELGDPDDLEIEIDVLSRDAVRIIPGAKVILEHWGGDEPLLARVRLVEPAAFLKISALGIEEQRVNVIADLVGTKDARARLGDAYRVEARVVIWESDSVLKVPSGTLFRSGDSRAVFVMTDGQAQLRSVRVGHDNGLEAEILDGLTEGEQVVLHPGDRVKDGVQVEARVEAR